MSPHKRGTPDHAVPVGSPCLPGDLSDGSPTDPSSRVRGSPQELALAWEGEARYCYRPDWTLSSKKGTRPEGFFFDPRAWQSRCSPSDQLNICQRNDLPWGSGQVPVLSAQ